MKNIIKMRRLYLREIIIAILISLGIVSIFGFKYLEQINRQLIRHSKMFIQTHRRIDLFEERMKEKCSDRESTKPVSL